MTESKTKELERVCLASLIQHNEAIPDLMGIIKPEHFTEKLHRDLYRLIMSLYQETGNVDEILLVTKAKSIGMTTINDYSVADYVLEVLRYMSVNIEEIPNYFRELAGFFIKRRTYSALGECQQDIKKNLAKPLHEILPELEKKISEALNLETEGSVEFNDLYGDMEAVVKERAESESDFCILSGFETFDKKYGGFPYGSLYIFAAPAKTGKSTWLLQIAKNAAKIAKNNCKVLFLDTELLFSDVVFRNVASLTDEKEWLFRSGHFRNNKNIVSKTEHLWEESRKMAGMIKHAYVANQNISQVSSVIRRWHAKHVRPGEAALVIVDYLKLGENEGDLDEWQRMGIKTDVLKKLAAALPQTAIVTAVQTNQQGNIAQSGRIAWFCSNAYKLIRKDPDEFSSDGEKFGSHKLVELFIRNQGEEGSGTNSFVKVQSGDGKAQWRPNYINYDFDNFEVRERGTYEDVLNANAGQLEPEDTSDPYEDVKF